MEPTKLSLSYITSNSNAGESTGPMYVNLELSCPAKCVMWCISCCDINIFYVKPKVHGGSGKHRSEKLM